MFDLSQGLEGEKGHPGEQGVAGVMVSACKMSSLNALSRRKKSLVSHRMYLACSIEMRHLNFS